MKKAILIVVASLFWQPVWASLLTYTCPASYRTVSLGNSMQQVEQACGKPKSVDKQQVTDNTPQQLLQWVYVLPGINNNKIRTNRARVIITFANGKVTEINTNHNLAGSFLRCYKSPKQLIGASEARVRLVCGAPTFVNTLTQAAEQQRSITIWRYEFDAYQPPVLFFFENGKLTKINQSN